MTPATHICSICETEENGSKVMLPTDWKHCGSKIVCADCDRRRDINRPFDTIPGSDTDSQNQTGKAINQLPFVSNAGVNLSGAAQPREKDSRQAFGAVAVHRNREWQIGLILGGELHIVTMAEFRTLAAEGMTLLEAMEQNWEVNPRRATASAEKTEAYYNG